LGWEVKTPEEALRAGRRVDLIPEKGLWPDFVIEIEPPLLANGSYRIGPEGDFGTVDPSWVYEAGDKMSWFAPFISGAHRIEDGHTIICSGPDGRFFEIDGEGNTVWEYKNPFSGGVRLSDGSMPQPGLDTRLFATFRVTKIPVDHPALVGRDLRPVEPQPEYWQVPVEEGATTD
jgi:hypothetical protein